MARWPLGVVSNGACQAKVAGAQAWGRTRPASELAAPAIVGAAPTMEGKGRDKVGMWVSLEFVKKCNLFSNV